MFRGYVGRAFCPGHRGTERARPVAASARVEAGSLPSAGFREKSRIFNRPHFNYGCYTAKGVFRGNVGRAFCPGHRGTERARPVASSARVAAGSLPSAGFITFRRQALTFFFPARRRRDHAATATCNLTGDTGDLLLHPVVSLALLGSGIRAVILEPAGSNNQNQTLQPNDALFHPPLQGLEILTMPYVNIF